MNTIRIIYEEYIKKCNLYFEKDSMWWYTLYSSRERYGSNIHQTIINHYQGKVKRFEKGYHSSKWSLNLKKKFPLIKSIGKILWETLKNIIILLFSFRSRRPIKKLDIVFIRPLHDLPLKILNNKVWDHYFGELPMKYVEAGKKISFIGPLDPTIAKIKEFPFLNGYQWENIIYYLNFKDIFYLFWRVLSIIFIRNELPVATNSYEEIIRNEIKKEILSNIYSVYLGSLYEYAFKQFIKETEPSFIFITYENNWWERSFLRAARHTSTIRKTIGFLHCAIIDSHLKYNLFEGEWFKKYSPDSLLVTGKEAINLLRHRGDYPSSILVEGYDLRGPNLFNLSQKKGKPKNIQKVLLLLEGLDTMPALLMLVIEALKDEKYRIFVRCHPVYPIENSSFDSVRNHPEFKKIVISNNKKLEDDLFVSDIVVYMGTTSSLYAAYMGIPLLRFENQWWASDDPLKECSAFKYNFKNKDELLKGLLFFDTICDLKYEEEKMKIQNYVLNYIRPYRNEDLSKLALDLIN